MKPTKPTFHGFLCKFDALVYDRKMQTLQRYCQRSTLINRLTSKGKFGMCWSLICMCATSLHCVFCCSLEEKRLLEFFSFMFAHHDTKLRSEKTTKTASNLCMRLTTFYQSIGGFFSFVDFSRSFFLLSSGAFFCFVFAFSFSSIFMAVILVFPYRLHQPHYQHQIIWRIIIGYSAVQIYARYRLPCISIISLCV